MSRSNGWALIWALVAALLAAFGQELALGNVPLPASMAWLIPIIVAGISAMSPYLKAPEE